MVSYLEAKLGSVPICMRDIDREFESVFVTLKDSGIKTPADLKGKSFASARRAPPRAT
jgi:ABC-type phosphate/phosphonate transport system substrate-binding protein